MKDNNQRQKGIPQKSNFNEWYPFIVEAAELIDKGIQLREWMFGDLMVGKL